jgi:precorrin-6A synthase
MRTLHLIGIGPGDPKYLTVQAIDTMGQVDVFFLLEKTGFGKEELLQIRHTILDRYATRNYRIVSLTSPPRIAQKSGYHDTVLAWHAQKRKLFAEAIHHHMEDHETAALLLWGDPGLYDQTISLIATIAREQPGLFDYTVVPGITSIQALTAGHKIPLNRIGESIIVTTGRQAEVLDPATVDNVVVMLDYNSSFQRFREQDMTVYWGGMVGHPDETLLAGPVDAVCDEIIATKQQLRARRGWLMDIYLLRRNQMTVQHANNTHDNEIHP